MDHKRPNWDNHQTSPQPNFQGPSSNNNEDMGCAGEPLKNEKFHKNEKSAKTGLFCGVEQITKLEQTIDESTAKFSGL